MPVSQIPVKTKAYVWLKTDIHVGRKKKNTSQNLPMIYSTIQTATKDRAMTKKKDNLEENP